MGFFYKVFLLGKLILMFLGAMLSIKIVKSLFDIALIDHLSIY